jgi:glycosyltransferase involved in cell wall biosynthesis
MVPTPSLGDELIARGFGRLTLWGRGVDGNRFCPGPATMFADMTGPRLLYVGRIAAEKNIEAFLSLRLPGSKIVVGDGPNRTRLERLYPKAHFIGFLHGEALAAAYRSADVLVFPSRTDTFGNVVTEALASGTPVAAYPAIGPRDILTDPRAGALRENLEEAVRLALTCQRRDARALGERFTWTASASQFLDALVPSGKSLTAVARAG